MQKRVNTRQIGKMAEDRIVEVFRSRGKRLLVRNYEVHNVGELDAVFVDPDNVYVVEVRARKSAAGFPTPAESVDHTKRRKIVKTTRHLIREFDLYDRNIYFLIGQVTLDGRDLVQNVEFTPF